MWDESGRGGEDINVWHCLMGGGADREAMIERVSIREA